MLYPFRLRLMVSKLGDSMILLQEFPDKEQALCLNVITNCVVLWYTVYMQEILKELQEEVYAVDTLDISHLSPARFAPINRLGKYSFEFNESTFPGTLR